jgi:hypothetical protein
MRRPRHHLFAISSRCRCPHKSRFCSSRSCRCRWKYETRVVGRFIKGPPWLETKPSLVMSGSLVSPSHVHLCAWVHRVGHKGFVGEGVDANRQQAGRKMVEKRSDDGMLRGIWLLLQALLRFHGVRGRSLRYWQSKPSSLMHSSRGRGQGCPSGCRWLAGSYWAYLRRPIS